ncbi:MAG: 7-carboxy-7-deazaguanine synthase QueE [Bacillota bacterium]|uniref:7-carboxy-7-deazaguanine synthase QueE n=1 Tax=Bacillus sp. RO2 TaxID=2723913 RepID=UPI00145F91C5|nr:7-carboxy-7-deazaguanine synthase QueE [Bacillus sp. RO2]MEA3321872.1 7-carboxy-7-deazaguanine synthase QueE [Bacillota bacterium]NMH73113.1 7-carboxy-7-deazaguanine synthase QueE [Bacillus sp. RO2]
MSSLIPVLEIFGPTIQGEGMVIGQKTMFVRTAGCDYRCSWCDSAFTWDGSAKDDILMMSPEEIYSQLCEIGGKAFNHVTISGGNPALLKNIGDLVKLLHQNEIKVALETQGSKWQDWLMEIDDLTISPKPPSSGMDTNFSILSDLLGKVNKSSVSLKVVVFDEDDLTYAKKVHKEYPDVAFYVQVGNDDTTTEDDEKLVNQLLGKYEWLIDQVMKDDEMNNVRVLPQLHTLVWGNKRGV